MSMFPKLHASSILGINARNLQYLSRYNSKADKKFADDKIFTKQFLESRHIGVAKMFYVVRNYRELTDDFFAKLPETFVIKPNRGFAGGGILVIRGKKGKYWVTVSGRSFDKEHLFLHCIDILEGKYSISGVHDDVIFEEVLEPHPDFRVLTQVGLPDIRVIVFNLVPVMAMLRVPNSASDGKANMELGAIAMGIDMGTGKTTGAAAKSKSGIKFIRRLPNGEPSSGFEIPFWEEILAACSKIQQVTEIGFLGVDLVVTRSGVKVLEINARPGLKIQVANRVSLKKRLEKVQDLKVLSPEDGVDLAKTLFSHGKTFSENDFKEKPVIGTTEHVMLNTDPPRSLIARIDLHAEENSIDTKLVPKTFNVGDITVGDKRFKLPFLRKKVTGADMVIAGKFLRDFYIDPSKVLEADASLARSSVEEKMLKNLDDKIAEIDSHIKVLSQVNPRNLQEQKDLFWDNQNYNPRFLYRENTLDVPYFRNELKKFPILDHPLYPLYQAKIQSLEAKLGLLETRDTSDFRAFSHKVYGKVTKTLYQSAVDFIQKHKRKNKPDQSEEMDLKKSTEIIQSFLKKYRLNHWAIKTIEDSVVDIQVTKKEAILLKKGATFRHNRLQGLLVHEIGTHVFRYENGKRQPLRIFERGTAGHLRTEEGLAVWNQNALGLPMGDKFLKPAYLVIAIYMADKMGFADLFQYLKSTYRLDDEFCWSICIKVKRGYGDTEQKGAFTKDMIYFAGHQDVEKYFAKKNASLKDLYRGKIAISDLPYLEHVKELRDPMFML